MRYFCIENKYLKYWCKLYLIPQPLPLPYTHLYEKNRRFLTQKLALMIDLMTLHCMSSSLVADFWVIGALIFRIGHGECTKTSFPPNFHPFFALPKMPFFGL